MATSLRRQRTEAHARTYTAHKAYPMGGSYQNLRPKTPMGNVQTMTRVQDATRMRRAFARDIEDACRTDRLRGADMSFRGQTPPLSPTRAANQALRRPASPVCYDRPSASPAASRPASQPSGQMATTGSLDSLHRARMSPHGAPAPRPGSRGKFGQGTAVRSGKQVPLPVLTAGLFPRSEAVLRRPPSTLEMVGTPSQLSSPAPSRATTPAFHATRLSDLSRPSPSEDTLDRWVDPQNALGTGAVSVGARRAAEVSSSGRSERAEDDRIVQRHANVGLGGRTIVVKAR